MAVAAIGAMLVAGGQIKQNMDAARAEDENAQNYFLQADRTAQVYARKYRLLSRSQDQFAARQKSAFAKAGISLEGSALDVLTDTRTQQVFEREALRQEARWDIEAFEREGRQAGRRAQSYNSFGRNFMEVGGSLLSFGARSGAAKGKVSA